MIQITIGQPNKVGGEYALFMSFPYDETIINTVRSLPSRFWHSDTKEWEVPFAKLSYLLDNLNKYEIEVKGDMTAFAEKTVTNVDLNFEFKTKPYNHQIDGFNYGLTHNKWLLGDEQGLGKTWQVINIAIAKKLEKGYKHCLIICGVNGLKWNWVKEIATHSNETGYILGQYPANGTLKIGSNKQKLADLEAIDTIDSYFIVTNVESLRDDDINAKLQELCKNGTIGMIAIDEVHKCKNPTSQQGKGILKLSADTMIAMTGTPLMNNPLDLYIILRWLGYERHSFYQFKNHYCIMGGYGGYQIVGYQHMDELQDSFKEIMLRRLKEEVLDLPDKVFVNEYVELTAKQSQIYKEILMDLRLNADKIANTPNPLSQLIRLRQATGYAGILSTEIKDSAKLDRMEELVEEAVANGKKVVIFSNWTSVTDEAIRRLANYNPAVITGDTKDSDRPVQEKKFQNDDTCHVIVGTIGAMGTGLTLTAGTVEIFLDEPWNMALKNQAVDRCHRIGAQTNVTIYTLLTKNTIDERINEIVAKKGALSDKIIDGKTVEDKKALIDYLLS